MKRLLSLFLLLLTSILHAQPPATWHKYAFEKVFAQRPVSLSGDAQLRFRNGYRELQQLLVRAAGNLRPDDSPFAYALGYAYLRATTREVPPPLANEHRLHQQIAVPQPLNDRLTLRHRLRIEQRFVRGLAFRMRYRYRLGLRTPLNAPELQPRAWYVTAFNEIFFGGTLDAGEPLFDQQFDRNRTYLGAGYVLSDHLRAQLGWMRQVTPDGQRRVVCLGVTQRW